MCAPILVVLAAGLGSRFGGLKQLAVVGPAGETMLDFAVFDAARAGFRRIVFVIRREFEAEFRARVEERGIEGVDMAYAFQLLGDLPGSGRSPAGRTKPWGTAHAVWCARALLDGPFAVVNADDFYGRESFARLSGHLATSRGQDGKPLSLAMVGFRLAQTLSEHGAVSRGVCAVDASGRLRAIVEHTGIRAEEVGPGKKYSGDEIVSMNCWAFPAASLPAIGELLGEFVARCGSDREAEFGLPTVVSELITRGTAGVTVLPTGARWFGVTYRADHPGVVAAIRELVAAGEYPRSQEVLS